jgi:hypothetical protein
MLKLPISGALARTNAFRECTRKQNGLFLISSTSVVIPAHAGIQMLKSTKPFEILDPRLRGDDELEIYVLRG